MYITYENMGANCHTCNLEFCILQISKSVHIFCHHRCYVEAGGAEPKTWKPGAPSDWLILERLEALGGPAAAAELCEWERWQGLCWVHGEETSEEEESLGSEQHHHPGHHWLLGQSCIPTAPPWGWPLRRRRKSRSWRRGGDEDTGKVRKAKGSGGCWTGRLQRHGASRALAGSPCM